MHYALNVWFIKWALSKVIQALSIFWKVACKLILELNILL